MDRFRIQARLRVGCFLGLATVALSAATSVSALTFTLSLNNAHEVMTLDFIAGPEGSSGYPVESIVGGGTLDGVQVVAMSTPNTSYGNPYNIIDYTQDSGFPPRALDFFDTGGVSVEFDTLAANYDDTLNFGTSHFFFSNQDVLITQESACPSLIFNCVYDSGSEFVVAAGTPEPSTWILMLIGFGGLGLALRRHREEQLPRNVCGSHTRRLNFKYFMGSPRAINIAFNPAFYEEERTTQGIPTKDIQMT